MTLTEALKILGVYQKWRLGAEIPMIPPNKVTKAIDVILQEQDKNKYSEENMKEAISIAYSKGLAKPNSGRLSNIPDVQNDILQQFKKK